MSAAAAGEWQLRSTSEVQAQVGARSHGWLAAYAAVGTLAGAVLAALATMATNDSIAFRVAGATTGPEGAVQQIAGALPLGYALAAGMLAAINPCGVAMLPGYLALYLREGSDQPKAGFGRMALVSGVLTASFVALFGLVGLLLAVMGGFITGVLPVLSLLIGVALVIAGARSMTGSSTSIAGLEGMTAGLVGAVRRPGLLGYVAYALVYAVTSISCTLPIFLSVIGVSVSGSSAFSLAQLILYGLGMGVVIFIATVAVGQLNTVVLRRIRGFGQHLNAVVGVAMLAVGGYIVYYWLTFGEISIGQGH